MRVIRISPQSLTPDSFAPFGVVVESRGSFDMDFGGDTPAITGTTSERRPFRFEFMARHRKTMQVFSPLVSSQSIIAVAPANDASAPDVSRVVAFHVDGRLPYAYHKGTWHTPPFPIDEWASYLVVDRSGTLDDDYELCDLKSTRGCVFEIEVGG